MVTAQNKLNERIRATLFDMDMDFVCDRKVWEHYAIKEHTLNIDIMNDGWMGIAGCYATQYNIQGSRGMH